MSPPVRKQSLARRILAVPAAWLHRVDHKALSLQGFLLLLMVVMGSTWYSTLTQYEEESAWVRAEIAEERAHERDLPPRAPAIALAVGSIITNAAFLCSLLLRRRQSETLRARLVQISLWIAAIGVLAAWLPADFALSRAALFGRGFIGEQPSQIAYIGKLLVISLLVISFPLAARLHFRSSLLDQYVIRNLLTPFTFCLTGFVAIWLIADLTDNGTELIGASAGEVVRFYVVQLPFMILFVMPVTLLLSLLYSLSQMSKANEIVTMLGAGRSLIRVLRPVFLFGVYASLVSLAFKYDWAPRSAGYKEAVLAELHQRKLDRQRGGPARQRESPWARTAWMHVNELDNRTWFIGRVPLDMRERELRFVCIRQYDPEGNLVISFRASSAKWFFGTQEWRLANGKTLTYDPDGVPHVDSWNFLTLPGWRDTPWKVVSSAQDPQHMGIPGLTTFLKTNRDYDDRSLAPFRTNWWYSWAEPATCLVMALIAAPLGIGYSRRGALGGVASSIIIFALIYFLSGSLVAAGEAGRLPPFLAAWGTNLAFGAVGLVLLWSRARNRDLPTLKILLARWRARRSQAGVSTA